MNMFCSRLGFLLLLLCCSAGPASAQAKAAPGRARPPGAISIEEATAITQVWAMLAQGLVHDASKRAAQVLAVYPRSGAAAAVAVEVEIARAGALPALALYERWLGARHLEEPSIVRRIVVALLHETIGQEPGDAARLEALKALAAEGDATALAELSKGAAEGHAPELRSLAAMGDERAVARLIEMLDKGGGNATGAIEALAQSGSRLAVSPLTARLQHQAPEIRGAAVEGLGELGRRHDVVDRIKPLLEDTSSYVRIKAAAALYRLGDASGLAMLQGLWSAESDASRLIAAQALASQPDATWMDQVKRLTSAAEPHVRIGAARLIAPYDPALARQVVERAMADTNPAIRDMAGDALTDVAATDIRSLRQLLRLPDRLARTKAAARVLALVR
jgi:HEAT repeat protein